MAELSDNEQLIAGITGGDPVATSTLHDAFSDRIYFLALRDLRRREDAEDVRNETLLRVMQAIRAGRLASPDALPSYVLNTARNVIKETLRKGHRSESMEDRDFAAPDKTSPVDHTVKRAIEAVISRLKPRERDFLRLYYYDELPKEQISARLGIEEDRVRLIKSRALKSFREIYTRMSQM